MSEKMWKDIPGFEGLYLCNQYGDVKRVSGGVIKPQINNHGYYSCSLSKNGKITTIRIHRIVACLFVENPNKHNVVNHIDGNKLNNYYENLEWCTSAHNNLHAWQTQLNHNTVKQKDSARITIKQAQVKAREANQKQIICYETGEIFSSITEAAEKLNVNRSKISAVCKGKRKSTGGLRFQYLEERGFTDEHN